MISQTDIQNLLADVLQLGERATNMDRRTALLGNLPELDSMAVVAVITEMEDRFNIVVDDEDIDGQTFESLGSLLDFVNSKRVYSKTSAGAG